VTVTRVDVDHISTPVRLFGNNLGFRKVCRNRMGKVPV
jgi:hypothetical protein